LANWACAGKARVNTIDAPSRLNIVFMFDSNH
jgi:hypothetical protein